MRFNSLFWVELLSLSDCSPVSWLASEVLYRAQAVAGWRDKGRKPLAWDVCRFCSGRQSTCVPVAFLVTMADEPVAYSCLAWSGPWKFDLLPATDGTVVAAKCLTHLSSFLWSSLPISQPHQQTTALNLVGSQRPGAHL